MLDDNTECECAIIRIFPAGDNDYIALLPLEGDVIEEMGLAEKTVGISPVGCSVFAYNYIDIDWIEAAHGRALAVATAVKRLYPQNMVFTYQGDGDLSAIGTAESIHAAARGENVVAVYIIAYTNI